MNQNTEQFFEIYKSHINRRGAPEFLQWLEEETDFFTAPASTRYHLSEEGGLCEHSLNVFSRLRETIEPERDVLEESIAICGLLHDVCKANFYATDYRNAKNSETGVWERVPYYTVQDQFPFGHGEKSVFLIQRFMALSDEEALAIRWHMGAYDASAKVNEKVLSEVYQKYPLALYLHFADQKATYFDEKK